MIISRHPIFTARIALCLRPTLSTIVDSEWFGFSPSRESCHCGSRMSRRNSLCSVALVLLLLINLHDVSATTTRWIGPTVFSSWFNGNNWDNGVPTVQGFLPSLSFRAFASLCELLLLTRTNAYQCIPCYEQRWEIHNMRRKGE